MELDAAISQMKASYQAWCNLMRSADCEEYCQFEEMCPEYPFLGDGCFANVYALNENYVVKIVKDEDAEYARYVQLITQNDNPHFVRVHTCDIWNGQDVYVLERLRPFNDSNENDRIAYSNFIYHKTEGTLLRAVMLLIENNLFDDIHDENVMFRGNTLVITDPSSGYDTYD